MSVRIQPPPGDPAETTRMAKALLDAADDPQDVKTVTDGSGLAFLVPDQVAKKANLNIENPDEEEPGKKKSAKKGNA